MENSHELTSVGQNESSDERGEWEDDGQNDVMECISFRNGIQPFVRYYMPFIIVIGLMGNFLSALTFMASKLRKIPSSHYLTALAFADSGMLLCHVLLMSGGYPSVPGLCQLTYYCGGVFSFLSVWFVVSFTLERFIAVRYPLRRLKWCTVERARMGIYCLTAFACLFNSHLLISVHAGTNPYNQTECTLREGFMDAASTMNHLDTALTFVIPLILIVIWNTAIAATTICAKGRRKKFDAAAGRRRSGKSGSLFFRGTPDEGMAAGILLPATTAGETFLGGESRRHVCRKLVDERKITRMLLVVSLIFLLMNFPDYVVRMVVHGLLGTGAWANLSNSEQCWIGTVQKLTTVLFNTNFAINFFLYSLIGANFRDHLNKLLCRIMRSIFEKLDDTLPQSCRLRRSAIVLSLASRLAAVEPAIRSRLPSTSAGYGSTLFPPKSSLDRVSSVPLSLRHDAAWSPGKYNNNTRRMTTTTLMPMSPGLHTSQVSDRGRLCSSNGQLAPSSVSPVFSSQTFLTVSPNSSDIV